ncbi:hypothetical protein [Streptomyces buecherae]|uniref:hypothetical protein n=1 Tax=Streptomyces buecherae TaxID=2763006 RepID=UPI0036D01AE9
MPHTPDGKLYARGLTAGGDTELSRRDPGAGTMRPVSTFDGSDYPLDIRPFQLTPGGTGAWLGSSRDGDRTRVVRPDLATGAETEVDGHPTLDPDPLITRSRSCPRDRACAHGAPPG